MTVRTCFSCTTISVYGIMSKNCFSSCFRDSLGTLAGALVSRLRVQRYNNSANHQNITTTFFKKNCPNPTLPYNNLCARMETHTWHPLPLGKLQRNACIRILPGRTHKTVNLQKNTLPGKKTR